MLLLTAGGDVALDILPLCATAGRKGASNYRNNQHRPHSPLIVAS